MKKQKDCTPKKAKRIPTLLIPFYILYVIGLIIFMPIAIIYDFITQGKRHFRIRRKKIAKSLPKTELVKVLRERPKPRICVFCGGNIKYLSTTHCPYCGGSIEGST